MQILGSLLFLACASGVAARDLTAFNANESSPDQKGAPLKRRALRGADRGIAQRPVAKKQQRTARRKTATIQQKTRTENFDFIVAGFPKCGSTRLLKAFRAHEETDMASTDRCAIASPMASDSKVLMSLDRTLEEMNPAKKRSMTCPSTLFNYKAIARMEEHSPNAKYVIGMRHPIEMLQSYYNYRIAEIKERGLDEPIPSLEEVLVSGKPWKGVSMQSTRFELFLMQLGKADMTAEDLEALANEDNFDLAIKPTNTGVFLYTLDQMEDSNEERNNDFRAEMQRFLALKQPLRPFGHEKENVKVDDENSVDICDAKWTQVRAQLVRQGATTAAWIRNHLLQSDEVVVANQRHFLESLESWSKDPCVVTK